MCWVIGGLLSTGILTGLMKNETQWGYRIPFALQWIWPIPIMTATLLAPESPWWLVRQGRVEEAKEAIRKITTPTEGVSFDLDAHVEMMVVTNEYEKQVSAGTNYWHLFRGSDLHRTEVSAMAFITQALCGVPFMGFGTQFMQGVGLSQDDSFHLTIGQDCLGLVGCFIAWWIMTRFGRRPIYLAGLTAIFTILLIVGFIGLAPPSNKSASLAGGILIILMIFCFQVCLANFDFFTTTNKISFHSDPSATPSPPKFPLPVFVLRPLPSLVHPTTRSFSSPTPLCPRWSARTTGTGVLRVAFSGPASQSSSSSGVTSVFPSQRASHTLSSISCLSTRFRHASLRAKQLIRSSLFSGTRRCSMRSKTMLTE